MEQSAAKQKIVKQLVANKQLEVRLLVLLLVLLLLLLVLLVLVLLLVLLLVLVLVLVPLLLTHARARVNSLYLRSLSTAAGACTTKPRPTSQVRRLLQVPCSEFLKYIPAVHPYVIPS